MSPPPGTPFWKESPFRRSEKVQTNKNNGIARELLISPTTTILDYPHANDFDTSASPAVVHEFCKNSERELINIFPDIVESLGNTLMTEVKI